ncbi:unnamed protein product [Prorocentrum cordatum]|uniref:Uncharacterized protein n=1 Tax=Prorocentrum cordatum TaxID=2364126 RepID=A0ABN9TXX7_9DINO|nr:unnamed protein product [Polarella glacialis]
MSLEASIKNCGLTKEWSAALRLLREGVRLGVQLVPNHYVATISACRKGGQWQHALSVLSEMWEAKLEPDLATTPGSARARAASSGSKLCRCSAMLVRRS